LTLTQTGAREAAFTILELFGGNPERDWLLNSYEDTQTKRIRQHIRFADFWYSANGIFTDLQEYTREIAREAGLELNAASAFRWLGTGGFAFDDPGQVGIGGLDLAGAKQVAQLLLDEDSPWEAANFNVYKLNVKDSELVEIPRYADGKVERAQAYVRGNKRLPQVGLFKLVVEVLKRNWEAHRFVGALQQELQGRFGREEAGVAMHLAIQVLEILVNDGWVDCSLDPSKPRLSLTTPREGHSIHSNRDVSKRERALKATGGTSKG
jgi:hypothetical protein